jgi:hypothetical protein
MYPGKPARTATILARSATSIRPFGYTPSLRKLAPEALSARPRSRTKPHEDCLSSRKAPVQMLVPHRRAGTSAGHRPDTAEPGFLITGQQRGLPGSVHLAAVILRAPATRALRCLSPTRIHDGLADACRRCGFHEVTGLNLVPDRTVDRQDWGESRKLPVLSPGRTEVQSDAPCA